jgi:hypothetical protein
VKHLGPAQFTCSTPLCSRCASKPRRSSHGYCFDCFAAYMRQWRKSHSLTDEQRAKDNARSVAGTYKARGFLIPQPCEECGAPDTEMHRPDYSAPLTVVWLCRTHRLMLHMKHSIRAMQRQAACSELNFV